MIKIKNFTGHAPKISGDGEIEYALWVDSTGSLYVQIVGNNIITPTPGTFDSTLFQVSRYISQRCSSGAMSVSEGYDINSKKMVTIDNCNSSAFLKAILRHLIPCE